MYLQDIPLTEAKKRFKKALQNAQLWGVIGVEQIPLDERAVGRTLAEPVWAKISSPHYHAAAMDGFAVRSDDTIGAMLTTPVILSVGAQAQYIDTGEPLPGWADAVIQIENVEALDGKGNPAEDARQPNAIRLREAVTPWSHVRAMGEDLVATQLVIPAGEPLRAVDLGAAAASGNTHLFVARKPKVAILPTGSELVPIGSDPAPGEILEFNSMVLASQVKTWGGEATRLPITADDFDQICTIVMKAVGEYDLILLCAGSSAGSEDYSAKVVQTLGKLLVHGVAVRPGHPVILGMINNSQDRNSYENYTHSGELTPEQTPIIGIPGYPVSAALTGEIFVEPLIAQWLGRRKYESPTLNAELTRKVTSPAGDDDYVRVALGRVGDRLLAAPLARGAGVISSLVKADGIVLLPRGSQGAPAGAVVQVQLIRSQAEIDCSIFATGSHDVTLDIIAQFLSDAHRRLTAANIGSIAGLVALSRGDAHLAGSHLLDPDTGEYNLSYIKEYLPQMPVMVVALVERVQGLLVSKGNPKHIKTLSDLIRQDVRFVNRQRGAGTRLLLDYHLEQSGLAKDKIKGYQQEEFTHLAVGAAIASGRADCGLGIAAVTHALNIDFIPLFQERYDLVIPRVYAESDLLAPLFDLFTDKKFRQIVMNLPGYGIEPMGDIIAEISPYKG